VPEAPESVVATAGDGQVLVSWTAPADPDHEITHYSVATTPVPDENVVIYSGTTATVQGLTNGGTYTFTVAAINAVGAGPATASAAVMPAPEIPFDVTPVAIENTASALDDGWRRGPFMEIYVRAYRDASGDGEGDLDGIIEKLDYLQELGVRGIWLMPMMPSQDNDHGYMVTNYRDVHPDYGSLAKLDALLAAAHARGIGVIIDYVLNHSAKRHPGFVASSTSTSDPWRDWYIWSPEHLPGWTSVSGGDPWRPSTPTSSWYYASFIDDMPDFNWNNQDVTAYHQNSFRYWLNRGVDGFRIDAAQLLVENGPGAVNDQPGTLAVLADLRGIVDGYTNRYLVCEAPGSPSLYAIANLCGSAFGFALGTYTAPGGSRAQGQQMVLAALGDPASTSAVARHPYESPVGKLSTLLANHDHFAGKRLWETFGGDTPPYRLAAATLLLMPGTPFLYYGEEIGMAEVPLADQLTDFRQRGPMSWTGDRDNAGFSALPELDGPRAVTDPAYKYIKPVPNVATANVAAELDDPASLLTHYRALIALRNAHPALSRGNYRQLMQNGASFVFSRSHADEEILVAVNYQRSSTITALQVSDGAATYTPLFAYGTTPGTVTTDSAGATSLAMPAQSVQVFHRARASTPFGVDVYLRGSMNDWADPPPPAARLAYDGQAIYHLTVPLTAGDHIFKVAPADWSTPMLNLGAVGGRAIALDEPLVLEHTGWRDGGVGADVHLTAPSDGDYRFSVDATNVLAPVLVVTRLP
jgi:alpha-amylase